MLEPGYDAVEVELMLAWEEGAGRCEGLRADGASLFLWGPGAHLSLAGWIWRHVECTIGMEVQLIEPGEEV